MYHDIYTCIWHITTISLTGISCLHVMRLPRVYIWLIGLIVNGGQIRRHETTSWIFSNIVLGKKYHNQRQLKTKHVLRLKPLFFVFKVSRAILIGRASKAST